MNWRDDGGIRPEIAVVADNYFGIVLNCKIKIRKEIFADFSVFPVVKSYRSLYKTVFSE